MLKPRITARQLIWISAFLLMLTILMMAWSTLRQQESTLAIRAVNQGASMPDGFSVLHHLDANGIHFKSIVMIHQRYDKNRERTEENGI